MQKEMDNSIKLKRLGDPCGETLFGKTVGLNLYVYAVVNEL